MMSTYANDPGGIFRSDTHRRVLGHLPLPEEDATSVNSLGHRISPDAHHKLRSVDDLREVLHELEGDGYAIGEDEAWKQTEEGFEALNASLPEEPEGPVSPPLLEGLV